jgi:hypothetical protein
VDSKRIGLLERILLVFTVLGSLEYFFLTSLTLHFSVDKLVLLHLLVKLLSEHSTKSLFTTSHELLGDLVLSKLVFISLLVDLRINLLELFFTLEFSLSTSALFSSHELLLHLV